MSTVDAISSVEMPPACVDGRATRRAHAAARNTSSVSARRDRLRAVVDV